MALASMRRLASSGDLIARGIINPAKVVRSALQGAASIGGLLITTEAMVAEVQGPPPPELPGHHDHEGSS
jgi:chaperonin GroEL